MVVMGTIVAQARPCPYRASESQQLVYPPSQFLAPLGHYVLVPHDRHRAVTASTSRSNCQPRLEEEHGDSPYNYRRGRVARQAS